MRTPRPSYHDGNSRLQEIIDARRYLYQLNILYYYRHAHSPLSGEPRVDTRQYFSRRFHAACFIFIFNGPKYLTTLLATTAKPANDSDDYFRFRRVTCRGFKIEGVELPAGQFTCLIAADIILPSSRWAAR